MPKKFLISIVPLLILFSSQTFGQGYDTVRIGDPRYMTYDLVYARNTTEHVYVLYPLTSNIEHVTLYTTEADVMIYGIAISIFEPHDEWQLNPDSIFLVIYSMSEDGLPDTIVDSATIAALETNSVFLFEGYYPYYIDTPPTDSTSTLYQETVPLYHAYFKEPIHMRKNSSFFAGVRVRRASNDYCTANNVCHYSNCNMIHFPVAHVLEMFGLGPLHVLRCIIGDDTWYPNTYYSTTYPFFPILALPETDNDTTQQSIPLPNKTLCTTISPNPANENIYIHSTKPIISATLLDIRGRTIRQWHHTNQCDIASIPSGTYFLRLETPDASETQKILISH